MYYDDKKYDGKKEKRFEEMYTQSSFFETTKILLDKQTGVQYLYHTNGNAAGLTVLMNSEGQPMVEKDDRENDL